VPDDLPYPMRKALEALAQTENKNSGGPAAGGDDDGARSTTSQIARDRD